MKNKAKNKKTPFYLTPWSFVGTFFLILLLLWFVFADFPTAGTHITPNPSKSYQESLDRIDRINVQEKAEGVRPECLSYAKTQGKKTDKVVVVFHGFTNCPIQFAQLADMMKAEGYNVVVMRLPHHGEADRNNNTLSETTVPELAQYANDSVDIADGLGDKVTVMGLSVGGDLTNWVAQTRTDVKYSFNMAPFYSPVFIPGPLMKPFVRILTILPDMNIWWDPKTKENNTTGSPYAYPGFSTKTLEKYLRFGNFWQQELAINPKKIFEVLMLNHNDKSINNNMAERWDSNASEKNQTDFNLYYFATDMALNHDIIDPYNPEQNTKYVYPIILKELDLLTSH